MFGIGIQLRISVAGADVRPHEKGSPPSLRRSLKGSGAAMSMAKIRKLERDGGLSFCSRNERQKATY